MVDERLLCERIAPDGRPYAAFVSGPAEIALHLPGRSATWLVLAVNSGRHCDAVSAVVAIREASLAGFRDGARSAARHVKQRLDAWPPGPISNPAAASWAGTIWEMFKLNIEAEIADLAAPCARTEPAEP